MLQHKVSTISVFTTTEYGNFIFINGNRPLNYKKINRIIEEIEVGNDMLEYYPIQVRVETLAEGDKLIVLDGQNRFFICKKLNRPVYYILVRDKKTMAEIARVNSNVEKWTVDNYINCYIHDGNENYMQLKQFLTEYGFSAGITLNLLAMGTVGTAAGGQADLFKNFSEGSFVVKMEKEAREIGNTIKQFSYFKNYRSRNFVYAIWKLMNFGKVPMVQVLEAFEKYKSSYVDQAHWKDHITQLEKFINQGKSNRIYIL